MDSCVKSELDLFTTPLPQTLIDESHYQEIRPIASITEHGPIEFVLKGTPDEFLDLSKSYLHIQCKITKADGSNLSGVTVNQDGSLDEDTLEHASVINYALHSMFKQVDITLGDKVMSLPLYPFKAYIETLLGFDETSKTSQLTASMWYKDTQGVAMNAANPSENGPNDGFKSRYRFTRESNTFDMIGRPHIDLFQQDRLILPGVDLRTKFTRSSNNFVIIADQQPNQPTTQKLVILHASLFVRKVRLSPNLHMQIEKQLSHSNVSYPIRRVNVKALTLPAGNSSMHFDNVFLNKMPRRLVLGFVKNSALNGSYDENPFNFEHFNLSQLSINIGGTQIPSTPFTPDFSGNGGFGYIRSYLSLFAGTGMLFENSGNSISREEYPLGYTLWAFDLTPDHCEGHVSDIKGGNLGIDVRFAQALNVTVNLIVFAEFDDVVEIDKSRNVFANF